MLNNGERVKSYNTKTELQTVSYIGKIVNL